MRNFKGHQFAIVGHNWEFLWWSPDNKKEIFLEHILISRGFLSSLFSKPFYSMLAYAEVCWSKGIAVYFPFPSSVPSDEYGECSCSWYKRKCLPLIKDLLQSANLIQSSAVLCSMLNASRSFMANRSPHLLHRGLHFVCPQTDTIQCSSWVSLTHQVECVLWFYHPFFFSYAQNVYEYAK